MKPTLVRLLACPEDSGRFDLVVVQESNGEIESGKLICTACGRTYPIRGGIPRFVPSDAYADAFSFEWKIHARTQLEIDWDSTLRSFEARSGYVPSELDGRLVLDSGCGMGRFMAVALSYGAEVVGVDLSYAAEQAYQNLGKHSKAHVVQADLMHLPFREETFDHVFSLGVLHHTPDPQAALMALSRHVRQNGSLSVSVYSRYEYPGSNSLYFYCNRWRPWTTKINKRWLYTLCSIAALILYPIYRLRIVRLFHLQRFLPISMHPNYEWRRLDTFDAYSPRYASLHTPYEVYSWFRASGINHIELSKQLTSMRGWKDGRGQN